MNSLPRDPVRSQALTKEAEQLRAERRWQEALAKSLEAFRADPEDPIATHNLGVIFSKAGRLADAEAALRHALKLAPNTPKIIHSLAHVLLAQGRFKEGWPLNEARAFIPELNNGFPTDFSYPRWRGESLAGKRIAIFPEQGLGDQIQFARFLPRLIDQAQSLTLLTPSALERLFRHNFPRAEIVVAAGAVEFPDPDYWITMQDLPATLGIEVNTIPGKPYLRAPFSWSPLDGGFKIGLKTNGNPRHTNDGQRSLPPDCAAELRTRLPGTLVDLDPEQSGATDLADTAAIIDQLDLVISVDTAVAHLAGALGKPCLLLIPGFAPDWRWMFNRQDSPWYPRHKLFRGDADGGWGKAVDAVVAEAKTRANGSPARARVQNDFPLTGILMRAKTLRDEGRFSEALILLRETLRKAPDNPAALDIMGMTLRDVGRLDEAERFHRRALALQPDYPAFCYDLGLNLLAQGRYSEAWPLYAARSDVPSLNSAFPKGIAAPRWKGENLRGKRLTIMPEQGLGDAIQFARFLPRLRELGAQTRLYVHSGLLDLFRTSFLGLEILPAEGEVSLGGPDYWTTLIDMAGPLGVTLETVGAAPYLHTDRMPQNDGPGFRVGIQTRGNARHSNDAWRSLPQDATDDLRARLPDHVVDLDPERSGARDFADTAALMQRLDLVVSVDTSVAHLAGALGKPCLLLLPSIATDWRWVRGRHDTPWYPAHRLYWGAMDGSWGSAIERVVQDAERLRASAADA